MYRGLGGFAPSTAAVAESFSAAFQCASDSPDLDTEGGPVRIEGARVLGPLDDYIEPDNNEHAELEPRDGHEPQQLSQDEVPRQQTRKGAVGSRFFGQQKSSVADSSPVKKGRTPTQDFRAGPRVGQDASMPSDRVRSVKGMLTNGSASNGKAGSGARSSSTEPVAIPRRTLKIKPLHQLTKPVLQPDRAAAGGAAAGEEGNEGDEKRKGPGGSSALVSPPLPSIDSFAHTRRLQSLSSFKPRSRLLGRQSQGREVGEKGGVTATAGAAGAAGASGTAGAAATGGAGNPSGNSSTVSFSSRASQLQQQQQPLVLRPFRVPRRLNANAAELSDREDTSCTTAATGASSNGDGVRGGSLGGRVAGDGDGVARDGFRRLQKGGRGGLAGSATAAAPEVDQMRSDQVEDEIEGFSVGEGEGRREGEGFGRAEMLTESSRGGGMEVGREGDGGMQGKRKRRKIVLVGSDGSDGDYEEEEEVEEEEEWGEGKRVSPLKRGDDAGRGAAATNAATFNARRFFGVRQPRDGPTQGGPQMGPGSSGAVQRAEREELRARLLALHAPSKGWRSARDPEGKGKKGGKKSGKDRWEDEDEEEDEEDDWIVEDDIDEEIEEEIEELEGLELEEEEDEDDEEVFGRRGRRVTKGKQKKDEWVRRSGRARRPARYAQSEEWEGEEEWGEGGEGGGVGGGGGGGGGEGGEGEEEEVVVTRRSVRAAGRAAVRGRRSLEEWEEEEEAEEDEDEEEEEEEGGEGGREYREKKERESDPVLEALRKSEQIAAALKQKLLLSAGRKQGEKGEMGGLGEKGKRGLEGGYAETDESAARLISQDDVSAACGESVQLKGYQLVGVNFLLLLYRQKVGGGEWWFLRSKQGWKWNVNGICGVWGERATEEVSAGGSQLPAAAVPTEAILADEMGLGKTVQAVVLLGLLGHLDNNPGPHLVVAPASLLDNWQRELQLWCPQLRVVLYHGGQRTALRELYGGKGKKGKKGKKERRRERRRKGEGGGEGSGGEGEGEEEEEEGGKLGFDVLLTCYSLFERDSAAQRDDRKFLRRFRFSCVLMDEAHLLKDRSSQRAMKLRQLAQAADYRLMLTGTPLQNDLQELWSLLEFLMPAIFNAHQCDIAEYLGKRDQPSQKGGGGGGAADEGLIGRMKAILGPFVLRRVKADVMKQLVAKVQKGGRRDKGGGPADEGLIGRIKAILGPFVLRRVKANVMKQLVAKVQKLANHPLLVRRLFSDAAVDEMASMLLKVLANHPLLVRRLFSDAAVDEMAAVLHGRGVFGGECTRQRVVEELRGYSDFTLNQLCAAHSDALSRFLLSRDQFFHSCKCQALSTLLPKLKSDGHRVLLFSQWTAVLDILQHVMGLLGLTFLRLDGSTQVAQRQALVDEFNRDPSVFAMLLSTRAGGQGLNLTGADTVILHDVDFNPQMDRQAEDRCHRIGQTRPVTVVRLVTRATVDEGILNIAQRKLSLDAALLSGGGEGESANGKGSEKGKGGSEEAQSMAAILSSILASKS
ncbi:unnamed protein product [Closterium sp. Naga37s-1]|nr:unnamed protein product [Closterium sp. Naga37s-1]